MATTRQQLWSDGMGYLVDSQILAARAAELAKQAEETNRKGLRLLSRVEELDKQKRPQKQEAA